MRVGSFAERVRTQQTTLVQVWRDLGPYLGTVPIVVGQDGGLRKMLLIATSLVKAYYSVSLVTIY